MIYSSGVALQAVPGVTPELSPPASSASSRKFPDVTPWVNLEACSSDTRDPLFRSARFVLIHLLHIRSSRSETGLRRSHHASGCQRKMNAKKSSQHGNGVVAP